MKVGLLITGIILMVIGAIGFLSMQQNLSDCGSFVGQMGRMFSSQMNQNCQTVNIVLIGGGVLFVIGLGIMIGGAVMKSESESNSGKIALGVILSILGSIGAQMIFPFPYGLAIGIGIIVIIIWIIKKGKPKKQIKKEKSNSLEILKERYAKGEITKEEFDKMKEDLKD